MAGPISPLREPSPFNTSDLVVSFIMLFSILLVWRGYQSIFAHFCSTSRIQVQLYKYYKHDRINSSSLDFTMRVALY